MTPAMRDAYERQYRNVHNKVEVTIVVRVDVACHPDDAEMMAEKLVLAELDNTSAYGGAVIGARLMDTEVREVDP